MPAFDLVSSININAPVSKVRDVVADFNTWPTWSPWLLMEPEAQVTYQGSPSELGHGYDWSGKKVGAGGMVITSLDANRMETDLNFLKPFKSQADVAFDFESVGAGETKVNWHMDSSLPFFMFFMVNKMKAMIKGDYDRGLRMLKDYVETGAVPSDIKVEGVVDVPATHYAGKQFSSSMENISDSMGAAFPDVFKTATEAGAEIAGMPFAIYNKMDMVKGSCNYTAAIPVGDAASAAGGLPGGVEFNSRPDCKAFKLVHTGPYRHLGNAWSTAYSEMRYAKMKQDKQNPPFEIYVDDPAQTAEEALKTEIYIPLRG